MQVGWQSELRAAQSGFSHVGLLVQPGASHRGCRQKEARACRARRREDGERGGCFPESGTPLVRCGHLLLCTQQWGRPKPAQTSQMEGAQFSPG